ncbi:hypothetical protein BGX24_004847 [Mortierella sp. AD032]|nr:hypothetical protein BGX24_004847 [Mortierella sp. AD032]
MKENQPEEWFEDMGWHFNQDDDFVDKNGNMFDFKTQSDYYEFVHDKIQIMLHERLEQEYGFVKVPIPWDPSDARSRGRGPIPSDCPRVFVSRDVNVNPKVLLIVQGLGKVAPGQWARKLFTNGRKGEFPNASQFPYIKRALHLGWAVILHSAAKCVMIVAFSAGTWATLDLFDTNRSEFKRRVKAVALLDGSTGGNRYWQRDGDWLFKVKKKIF